MTVHQPRLSPAVPPDLASAVEIAVADKTFAPVAGRAAHRVLRDVSISLAPGSFVVITGPSGCGKSTLLNIVAGLDKSYTGSIRFAAPNPRLAFIFQTPRLLPWRTVEENIALALPVGDARHANIPELIARVGLSGAETAYPERLSLGMQRRAAIARAFVLEPDILLMDEPFVSLDDPTAVALRTLVVELWQRFNTTVLCVTHDRREAIRLATRVIQMVPLREGLQSNIVSDHAITLSETERGDRVALEQALAKVFANL